MINIPKMPLYLPWFIYDIDNLQLITSPIIPSDISDTKDIIFAEQPIPGLPYQPIQSGGMGNRKVSFTLQLIKRDRIFGNVAMLKQFEMLRNPKFSFESVFSKSSQFTPNPRVIYYWGVGSLPLVYYVKKANFNHKQFWTNAFGQPQYTEISMELILDESHPINKAETMFRAMSSYAGQAEGQFQIVASQSGVFGRPY